MQPDLFQLVKNWILGKSEAEETPIRPRTKYQNENPISSPTNQETYADQVQTGALLSVMPKILPLYRRILCQNKQPTIRKLKKIQFLPILSTQMNNRL